LFIIIIIIIIITVMCSQHSALSSFCSQWVKARGMSLTLAHVVLLEAKLNVL